jgi:hypothetical protein
MRHHLPSFTTVSTIGLAAGTLTHVNNPETVVETPITFGMIEASLPPQLQLFKLFAAAFSIEYQSASEAELRMANLSFETWTYLGEGEGHDWNVRRMFRILNEVGEQQWVHPGVCLFPQFLSPPLTLSALPATVRCCRAATTVRQGP